MPEFKCPTSEELSSYLLGRLPESASERLELHCEDCPTCQTALETLDGTFDPFLAELRAPGAELSAFSALPPELEKALDQASSLLDEVVPAEAPAPATSPRMPEKIRDYRLLAKIGEGGMGKVYKALHVNLKRIVALKVLASRRALDQQAVQRFRREMAAIGKLVHPNIVLAYDAGEHHGTQYLVTEFIDGADLSQLVRSLGPLPVADACEIARQAALALEHAHTHTLVHRDIKPSNLMLTERGDVKLLDLGLSRFYADLAHEDEKNELTSEGQIMGTLDYIAPEQACNAQQVDARADLYSLGATLYRLLTGQTPLELSRCGTPIAKLHAILEQVPAETIHIRGEVPAELSSIITRLLAKDRERRPDSAKQLIEMLTPFSQGSSLVDLMHRYSTSLKAGPALTEPTQANLSTAASKAADLSSKAPGSDMAEKQSFDPYHRWLGIPIEEQPPHHYRLLGTQLFESSPEVIEAAADRQMTYLRTMQTGQHSTLSQKLLNEISAAKVTLLNAAKRKVYDAHLKQQLAKLQAGQQPVVEKPLPKAIPLEPAPQVPAATATAQPQLVTRSVSPPPRQPASVSPVIVGETVNMAQRVNRKNNRNRWLMATAAGMCVFAAAVFVVRLANGTGELVIESNVPGVEVEVRRDGVTIETVKVDDNEHRITIRTGDYEVVLKGKNADELVIENESFTLQRDGQAIVKITRRERAPEAVTAKTDPDDEPAEDKRPASITVALGERKDPPAVPAETQPNTVPAGPQNTPASPSAGPPMAFAKLTEGNSPQPLQEGQEWGEKAQWKTIPSVFKGMQFQTSKLPARTNIEVTSPGHLFVAFTSRWGGGGSISADIAKELTSQDDLTQAGWKQIAALPDTSPHNYQFRVYGKLCKAGDKFSFRTEKYVAPILLLPNGNQTEDSPPIASSKNPVIEFKAPAGIVRANVTNDAKAVLLTFGDKTTRLYDPRTGKEIGTPATSGVIDGILPDGKTAFSAPWEGNFGQRDALTGAAKGPGFRGWQVKSIAFSPDGRMAAVGQYRGVVTITDLRNGQQREVTAGDRGFSFDGIAFSADGKRVIAIAGKGSGKLIDVAGANVIRDIEGPLTTMVAGLADGRFVVRSADGNRLDARDFETGKKSDRYGTWSGHQGTITSIAVAMADGAVVTTSQDKTARLWDSREGRSQPIWQHTAELESASFSPNGAHLVLAGRDGTVRVLLDGTRVPPKELLANSSTPPVASTAGNIPAGQPETIVENKVPPAGQLKVETTEGIKPAESIDSEVVCQELAGKRAPKGLVDRATFFQAPDGDGRRGANGFVIDSPQGWRQRGTVWSGTYSRSGSAYGMYLIHPLGDGHIVVSLWNGGLAAGTMKAWAGRALAQSEDLMPLITKVPASAFEIDRDEPHTFRSELSATGSFSFYLDGKLVATGKADHVHPLTLTNEGFRGEGLERKLAPGKGGAIADSLDNGSNRLVDLVLALPNSEVGLAEVPTAEAQETARKSLAEIFKNEISAAKTQPQQSELAKRLLQIAGQNISNLTDHFVVLEEARKYGVEAGDVETAADAAKAISKTYRVERWPLLAETVVETAKNSRTTAMKDAATKAYELGQEAFAVGEYEPANALLEASAATAGRAREFPIAKAARDLIKTVEEQIKAAKEFESAQAILAKNPQDPQANQLVGEHLCFEKDNWEQGLQHLIAGGEADLQPTLKLELAKPSSTQEQVVLGDAWWTLGSSKTGATKNRYLGRAAHWYEAAMPQVTGLERAKIEKRLKQISSMN